MTAAREQGPVGLLLDLQSQLAALQVQCSTVSGTTTWTSAPCIACCRTSSFHIACCTTSAFRIACCRTYACHIARCWTSTLCVACCWACVHSTFSSTQPKSLLAFCVLPAALVASSILNASKLPLCKKDLQRLKVLHAGRRGAAEG